MTNVKKFLLKHFRLLPVLLTIPAGLALLVPGYFGASDDLHAAWLFELDRALKMGQIPPRFVPDLSFGFGYPLFSFVYPLPFYIAEIFHLTGFSLVDSVKLLFLLTIPLSALLMYLFLRKFLDRSLALAGAVIYIYTPYRSVDIYIRGAIGEILSFVFLPLIGLTLLTLSEAKKWNFKWIGIGSLGISSLILTHNITAYMILPLFGLLFLFLLTKSNQKWLYSGQVFLSGLWGLLISCYFWLPAILESGLMKYDTVFNYVDHFPTVKQLITPYWGYGASVAGNYDDMPFFIGYPALVLIVSSAGIIGFNLIKQKKFHIPMTGLWALLCLLISFIMMNYRSIFLWDKLPLLPYFQFPWRFLIVVTFVTPVLLVLLNKYKYRNFFAYAILLLSISTMLFNFRPHDFLGRTDEYYLNRYVPYPQASEEYKLTQEEYLRLPKVSERRPDQLYPRAYAEGLNIRIDELNALDAKIEINATGSAVLDYNKYNYPGWVGFIDDKPIELHSGKPFGQIQAEIPPGQHTVIIQFRETMFRQILNLTSVIGLLAALFAIFWPGDKKI